MKQSYYQRDNCRLCNSKSLFIVLDLMDTPVGDAYVSDALDNKNQPTFPLGLYRCDSCGHLQLLDVVNPKLLYGNFTYHTAISVGLSEHFKTYSFDIARKFDLKKGDLVVDIGSNDGTLLRYFKDNHYVNVLGIEPAKEIAEEASRAGIETIPAYFTKQLGEKIREERGPVKVVTINNTIANIDDLSDFLAGVHYLLGNDGVLVLETGYGVDLIQGYLVDVIYHEHLGYFSVGDLKNFLESNAFELIDISRIPNKGGSLRAVVQNKGGLRKPSSNISDMILYEEALRVRSSRFYEPFIRRMEDTKEQMQFLLLRLRESGKNIIGFGASVGVTTLLYYLDLAKYLECLVDENPIKQDTYSPGFNLKVEHPSYLQECVPDYILILAWRYADGIIRKYPLVQEYGGRFIVPLPTISILS